MFQHLCNWKVQILLPILNIHLKLYYLCCGILTDDIQQLHLCCPTDKNNNCIYWPIFHSCSTPLCLDMEQYHPLNALLPQVRKDSCAPVHHLLQYSQSHYHNAAQWRYILAAGHQHDHVDTQMYHQDILQRKQCVHTRAKSLFDFF